MHWKSISKPSSIIKPLDTNHSLMKFTENNKFSRQIEISKPKTTVKFIMEMKVVKEEKEGSISKERPLEDLGRKWSIKELHEDSTSDLENNEEWGILDDSPKKILKRQKLQKVEFSTKKKYLGSDGNGLYQTSMLQFDKE